MNSNLLTNPAEEDFRQLEDSKEETEIIDSKDQLSLNVETRTEKLTGILTGLKMGLKKQNDFLEISQLWKSPAPALAAVSLAAILIILIFGGLLKYSEIGPTIPLFYDNINKQFIATDKIFIFISAIAVAGIEILTFRYITLISQHDRRLSIIMAWILFFFNILMLASIGQIYTIII